MEHILEGLDGVRVYQDDVLIVGSNEKEQDDRLRAVLSMLRDVGLALKAEKYKFNVEEIEYLGHVVNGTGIQPKAELVNMINRLKTSQSKEELLTFLGMAEFYSKFIPNMTQKTMSMRELLRKGKEFLWTRRCEEEFCSLNQCLNVAPNLGSFDTTDDVRK
ncbi:hypothetical protein NDU88_000197 [Pleurodeles waltl]|uniref:ribonuclease H n=1 Tax=Pleurodeles waltl TaxID=8319 RepID=A0AAV7V660_PLEWA|nr:hypothetical protein NDU88_000197 [Pleurodeles waltl]